MFLNQNNIPKEFIKFPRLANELNPRDTIFRADLDDEEREQKPPFTSEESPYMEKQWTIWNKLFEGKITEEEGLEEITQLMEEYYGMKYPLDRGFNH